MDPITIGIYLVIAIVALVAGRFLVRAICMAGLARKLPICIVLILPYFNLLLIPTIATFSVVVKLSTIHIQTPRQQYVHKNTLTYLLLSDHLL